MTAEGLAQLHAACFEVPRPWTSEEFQALLADPAVRVLTEASALIALRIAGPEAEVLTICTHPEARQSGIGRALLHRAESEALAAGVEEVFLEVSDSNSAALALYAAAGYKSVGRRKDYYSGPNGTKVSAIVLKKLL